MLHPARVAKTIYYESRGRLRRMLRIPPRRKRAPVISGPIETAVERHEWILRSILKHSPASLPLKGKAVCEVGAGDCLASASYFLAKGANRVDIVEVHPCFVDHRQLQILETLKHKGLPIDLSIIQNAGGPKLDETRVFYHRCFMEDFRSEGEHEFLFSFSVVEHVEDLAGFYKSCWKSLAPGGWMLHMVDLGGHGQFEDPLPPLDFQTYPCWLYDLMWPKYHRATRRFLDEHTSAVNAASFRIAALTPTRLADPAYLINLRPKLRRAARLRTDEELQVIEFALLAQKQA